MESGRLGDQDEEREDEADTLVIVLLSVTPAK